MGVVHGFGNGLEAPLNRQALIPARDGPMRLEDGDGIHRRAGGVMQAQRADSQHELPTVSLTAGLGHLFEIGVIQYP